MDVNTVACNICGCHKKEPNHWLVIITTPGLAGILLMPADAVQQPRNEAFDYEDLCGQHCLHKRLSRWLDDLNAPAPTTQESEAA
jgi:hypothetical protein